MFSHWSMAQSAARMQNANRSDAQVDLIQKWTALRTLTFLDTHRCNADAPLLSELLDHLPDSSESVDQLLSSHCTSSHFLQPFQYTLKINSQPYRMRLDLSLLQQPFYEPGKHHRVIVILLVVGEILVFEPERLTKRRVCQEKCLLDRSESWW